ncbi:MAG: RNA polymerase sigma factor [Candidatus Kapaibacterium sp.]|nr:MAG: RNA polymerase sigma factor [Candidatus Kapabacteria bacterium]
MLASHLPETSFEKTAVLSTEAHLLQRLKASDNAAFREFVRLYQRRLFTLAFQLLGNREDAEDLVQEAFIKAHGALAQFQGASSLYTWLHRIAVNLYIDYTRSGRYRAIQQWDDTRDDNADAAQWHTPPTTPEASFQAVLQQEHIENALQKLTAQQRAVFVLRHYQDLSLEEVAEELHVTVGTVKTLLFRAVRELREHLAVYRY